MSIRGISGTGSDGIAFDFSNMTRKQAIAAGGELYQQGKLTEHEMASLQGFSLDSIPVTSGATAGTGYGLNSTASRDYNSLIQQDLADNETLGTSQQREIANDKDLLNVLTPYLSADRPRACLLIQRRFPLLLY